MYFDLPVPNVGIGIVVVILVLFFVVLRFVPGE
jgi:hypothetical protein